MSTIKIVDYEASNGRLREIYDDIIQKRGKLAEVHKMQSLHPESIVKHMELYMEIMFSKSPLSRAEREMMAVVVSVTNGCLYCRQHHAEALNHYWKNDERLKLLIANWETAPLSEREGQLAQLASELTANPAAFEQNQQLLQLKNNGFTDLELLDASLVIAYFNFVNRLVLATGIGLETDGGAGYKY